MLKTVGCVLALAVGFLLGSVSRISRHKECLVPVIPAPIPQAPTTAQAKQFTHLLKHAVAGSLYDELGACAAGDAGCDISVAGAYNAELRRTGGDWPLVGHTMIGLVRLDVIAEQLTRIIDQGVAGDFVELGIWRGGACIFAQSLFRFRGQTSRKVIGMDVFDRMPGYGSERIQSYLAVPVDKVRHNFDKYGVLDANVHLIKGLFADTLPTFAGLSQSIAFLRIDGNFYHSYESSLYYLYDLVPVGGVVYFDDIPNFKDCLRAWEDFKRDQGLPETLTYTEGCGSWFVKQKKGTVDIKFYQSHK